MNKQLDLVTCTRYLDLVTCTRHLDLVICARYPDSSKYCRPQLSLISCRDFPQKATTPAKDEEHLSNLVVASENFVIGQIKLSSYFRKMRTSLNIVAAPSVCKSNKTYLRASVCVMVNRLLFACIQNTNIHIFKSLFPRIQNY